MIPILNSSYLHGVEYHESSNALIVEFHKGKRKKWRYCPVTEGAYQSMLSAPSPGSFFSKNIRDNPDITAEPID